MASYSLKIRVNILCTLDAMARRETASTGSMARYMRAMRELTVRHMITENMSMSGVRTAILITIWKEFCTLVTSVVSLVTREDVENRSISAKDRSCTLKNRSCLRFFANPADAVAPHLADAVPQKREHSARAMSMALYIPMMRISPVFMLSMSFAIT